MHPANASLDPVQDLLAEDPPSRFILMQPGASRQVSWHQDSSNWPLSPSKTVTVGLAIADADADNGAMRVIPRPARRGAGRRHRRVGR